jgi:glycosyltransferase involved in cell wall biosynthesis
LFSRWPKSLRHGKGRRGNNQINPFNQNAAGGRVRKEQWVVCQIGAREHYALAAELHRRGQLAALCTDIWTSQGSSWSMAASLLGKRGRKLRERYEPALRGANVFSESPIEFGTRAMAGFTRGHSDWDWIMAANRRFGVRMAHRLERSGILRPHDRRKPVVFAYSYGALEILQAAKSADCIAILGQIDPGPEEDALIARVAECHGHTGYVAARPPQRYWDEWRRECGLADVVIVNSSWSATLLTRAGIPDEKIRIVPLAYRSDTAANNRPRRVYPKSFSAGRPLKLLFLGQINLRKGTLELIAAMRRLTSAPVRLLMVGPVEPGLQQYLNLPANVEWVGPISRSAVEDEYRQSDLFVLPTHSDGFAITQLEALAHGLPVIASRHCGEVVIDGQNGYLIDTVTVDAIEEQLRSALVDPQALAGMSARAPAGVAKYAPERVVDALVGAVSGVRR